jgi:excisionase family DNA binding protein
MSNDKLLCTKEVSEILGISAGTLAVWRCTKKQKLSFIKVGKSVRYRIKDVMNYIEKQEVKIK